MSTVKFLPHQKRALESAKKEVILSGAFGSGKTKALCDKIVFLLTRYPRNRGFLCRKTLQSLKTTSLKTLLEGDGDMPPSLPSRFIVSHNKQERLITLTNGSELYYGNMDKEFIKSMNLGFAAVDELTELSVDDWKALSGRLRLSGVPIRQLIGATNPGSTQHWIWHRAKIDPPKDKFGNSIIDFITSSTLDNIYLPPEYVENLKNIYFGFYYDRYVLGKWVGADDIVYDNFVPQKHIIPSFEIPRHWKRYRTIDFGFRAPFFCGWIAIAGNDAKDYGRNEGDMILYREIYYTQRTTSVNAEKIIEFSKYSDGTPEKIMGTVADWDSGDRADLESKGIYTVMANKDITLGIQKVRERLGNIDETRGNIVIPRFFILENSLVDPDPKIRINIETGDRNNDPMRVAEEFSVYGWKQNKLGATNKEEPIDEYNHGLDAIRYFIMNYDLRNIWSEMEFLSIGGHMQKQENKNE